MIKLLMLLLVYNSAFALDTYDADLEKDCTLTITKIIERPGASWASEYGWAFEHQCTPFKETVFTHYENSEELIKHDDYWYGF
jgi:hypothetical protein